MDKFQGKPNYYAQLEVQPDCTQEEIKSSYKRLALQLHPDKNLEKDTTETFKLIGTAYETLSDLAEREKYDLYYEAAFENRPCFEDGPVFESSREPRERHQKWGPYGSSEQPHRPYFSDAQEHKSRRQQHDRRRYEAEAASDSEDDDGAHNRPRYTPYKPKRSAELDEIANIQGAKQERIANWNITKLKMGAPILKLEAGIAELQSEIECLEGLLFINMPKATPKYEADGWWEEPTCSDVESNANEVEVARTNPRIQELKDETASKQSALEVKEQALKLEKDLLRSAEEEIEGANQQDDQAIRKLQKQIRRKLASAREHAERLNLRTGSNFCVHRGWWPKVREVTSCPMCLDVRHHLLQCPGCDMLACVTCQSAIRPHSWAFRKAPEEFLPSLVRFPRGGAQAYYEDYYCPEPAVWTSPPVDPKITTIPYEEFHARRMDAERRAQAEKEAERFDAGEQQNGMMSRLMISVTRGIVSMVMSHAK